MNYTYPGRVLWTGRGGVFVNQPLGKNMVSSVPKEMAKTLGKENPSAYTFHSYRRSSASAAADFGATPQQMVDFFGWKSTDMTAEYISTSKKATFDMANLLLPGSKSSEEPNKPAPVETSGSTYQDSAPCATETKSGSVSGVTGFESKSEDIFRVTKNEKVVIIQSFNGNLHL